MSQQSDVCNIACAILGVSPVVAITDTTLQAITFNSIWNIERDAELRKRVWKFSITRAQLYPVLFAATMVAGQQSSNTGYNSAASYGTLSSTLDVNGNTLYSAQDVGGTGSFVLSIQSPNTLAQSYFNSVSIVGGTVNTTLLAANAVFSSGGGIYTWVWQPVLGLQNAVSYSLGLNTLGNAEITSGTPVNGMYSMVYPIPAGSVRLLAAGDQDFSFPGVDLSDYRSLPSDADYLVEGGAILSNIGPPVSLRYCASIANVALWDATFCEAMGARLAHRACFRVTQSLNQQKMAAQEYSLAIREAQRANALEGPPLYIADDTWILTRPIGSGGAPTTRIG